MENIPYFQPHALLFGAFTVAVFLLCLLVAWSRRDKLLRWSLMCIALTILPVAYFLVWPAVLSFPREMASEWYYRHVKEVRVAGVYIAEGKAIYLLLVIPGVLEPRYYSIPWGDEARNLAESLQEALESKDAKRGVIIENPFQPSLEREKPLTARPLPQTRPPPKQQPRAPIEYPI